MGVIYVARSVALSKWGNDVGLSKHLYKIGYTEEPLKTIVEQGWAGERDWALVAKQEVENLSEDEIIARVACRESHIDDAGPRRRRRARRDQAEAGRFRRFPDPQRATLSRALSGALNRRSSGRIPRI